MANAWHKGILFACMACGAEPSPAELHPQLATPNVASEVLVDPLLVQARELIEQGHGDAGLAAMLLASPRAAHRRAGRILAAMMPPPASTSVEHTPAASATPGARMLANPGAHATELVHGAPAQATPAQATPAHGAPAEISTAPPSDGGPRSGQESADAPSRKPRVHLEGVGLRSTPRGAELELRAKGGLMVGVAHQPAEGIVRLVLDGSAASRALSARPRVTGARVTEMHRVGTSIFVTVMMDPGWRLGGIVSTRRGARVRFERGD